MSRRVLAGIIAMAAPVLLMLGLFEGLLRLQPSLIGMAFLSKFPPVLATEIATRLGLGTSNDYDLVTSGMRADRGRDYLVYRAHTTYMKPADPIDVQQGIRQTITTDERGYCNPSSALSGGSVDNLLLSGSVPGCAGVSADQTLSASLSLVLGKNVYNMSIPAVGPAEYLDTLRRDGLKLKPRALLFAMAEADELHDVVYHNEARLGNFKEKTNLNRTIFASSYALSLLRSGIHFAAKTVEAVFGPDFRYSASVANKRVQFNINNSSLEELEYAKLLESGEISADLYREPLRDLVDLSRRNGFVPIVTLVPAAYTTYRDSLLFEDAAIATTMKTYSDVQRKWLSDNASELGYHFIDCIPAMQRAAKDAGLLYFPANVHLTAEGNKILAQSLAPLFQSVLNYPLLQSNSHDSSFAIRGLARESHN